MNKWPWKLYGAFYVMLVVGGLRDLFSKDSSFCMYYTILIAFDKHYLIFLVLNIAALLVDVFTTMVVFYYAFNIKSSLKFWQVFLFVRIFFDLVGHHYDWQFIKSSFYQSFPYALACIGAFVIPVLPSYMAHYLYAFRKPKTPS